MKRAQMDLLCGTYAPISKDGPGKGGEDRDDAAGRG